MRVTHPLLLEVRQSVVWCPEGSSQLLAVSGYGDSGMISLIDIGHNSAQLLLQISTARSISSPLCGGGCDLYQSIVSINNTNNHVKPPPPPLPVCAGRRFVTLVTRVTPADHWCDVQSCKRLIVFTIMKKAPTNQGLHLVESCYYYITFKTLC